MYSALKKEVELYEKRTPKSSAALKKSWPSMPLGVSSNFRSYEPYPLFIAEAQGTRLRDLDGNEYIDFALCFGAIMAGHAHPAVVKAVQEQLKRGTMYGMPHEMERELAEEIIKRYPVENVRFSNSGTEATMHAIRLARGFTGRDKIIKFEGCYHGVHDAAMVSVKPKPEKWGSLSEPNQVPASAGIVGWQNTLVATFNDLPSVEKAFEKNKGQVAALILEPVPMNIGVCMPQAGFLEGLRTLCTKHGALLIFDEVKTGAKLGRGGACEYFKIKPDMVCLAKSIGGGLPLGAFGARREGIDTISQSKGFHSGTHKNKPLVLAGGVGAPPRKGHPERHNPINKIRKRLF